jgi:DNA polymerase III epsilon subunit family exonuclease
MEFFLLLLAGAVIFYFLKKTPRQTISIDHLPEQFVVFDLETTGLDSTKHEIIEIAAIRVNRDSEKHDTIQSLVKPSKKIPKKIVEITGITQDMIDRDGEALDHALNEFVEFVGDLRLVSFNAPFDMAFLNVATEKCGVKPFKNPVSCALKMSRRAWPGRKSYKLADLAKDGNLDTRNAHRALADSQRALSVYLAAASSLRSVS